MDRDGKSVLSNVIADKLKNLESANQRLKEEKSSLQRQLDVVLHRLVDGRIPVSQLKADERFSRLEGLLKSTLRTSATERSTDNQLTTRTDAPIAKMEYLGIRDSISTNDSDNSLLQNKYSSLSDTYEEFCLKNDFTQEVRMSNLSSVKYEYESYFDENLPQELLTSDNGVDLTKSRTIVNPVVDSIATVADTVAGDTSNHDSKASTPVSMISNESSKFLSKLSFQDTETIVSSYSSSSDENLFVNRFHELKKRDHLDMKKSSRYSSSLPASLQLIDKKTSYFIDPSIQSGKACEEKQAAKDSVNKVNKAKYGKFNNNMIDSKTQIIRSSSPRNKPPTIKISRKRYENQNVASLLSVTTNEEPANEVNLRKSSPSVPSKTRTINGLQKSNGTDKNLMVNLLSSVYKTQPLVRIGHDFDFLNNFQNIPSMLSSELARFPDLRPFTERPGFGELIRFHEIFATVKSKSFLVQRVIFNPTSHQAQYNFKDENLFSLLFGNRRANNDAEINRKIASIMMESSSDAASTIFSHPKDFSRTRRNHEEENRDSLSILSLDYYQPPTEDDQENQINNFEAYDLKDTMTIKINKKKSDDKSQIKKVIHSGYISKLGSKFKIWHRFWCELTNVGIFFFTAKSKAKEAPTKCIYLSEIKSLFRPLLNSALSLSTEKLNQRDSRPDDTEPITKSNKSQNMTSSAPIKRRDYPLKNIVHHHLITSSNVPFFEIILNSGKIFTLKSETLADTERWLTNIRQMLKRFQAEKIVDEFNGSVQMQGWMKRIKSGQSRKVWCKLYNHFLIYYRSEKDENPIGYRSLIGSKLKLPSGNINDFFMSDKQEMKNAPMSGRGLKSFKMQNVDFSSNIFSDGFFSSDSDSDICQQSWTDRNRTFAIWIPNKDPLYLIPPNIEEFEKWKNYLLRACNTQQQANITSQMTSQTSSSHTAPAKLPPYQILMNDWKQLVRPSYSNSFVHSKIIGNEPASRTTEDFGEFKGWRKISELLLTISYPQNSLTGDSIDNLSSLPTAQYTPRDPRYQTTCVSRKYSAIKSLTDLCFTHPELKDELYLQLLRQCNPNQNITRVQMNLIPGTNLPKRRVINNFFCTRRRSIESLNSEERYKNGNRNEDHNYTLKNEQFSSVILAWECLSLIIPIFLPSPMVLAFLESFLTFHGRVNNCKQGTLSGISMNSSSIHQESPRIDRNQSMLTFELGKYAAFCYEMMERIKLRGHRFMTPSGLEVAAISMRNPYTYSLPFSLPIHLPSPGLYEVISFDGTTRVSNIIQRIQEQLGLKDAVQDNLCICALYCKLPKTYFSIGIDESMSLCDVISAFEQIVTTKNETKVSTNSTLELSFRVQSFSQKLLDLPTNRKTLPLLTLLVRQFHLDFIHGDFYSPLRGVDMLDLTSYILSMDRGHYNKTRDANLINELRIFLPKAWMKFYQSQEMVLRQLTDCLIERWMKISQMLEKCLSNFDEFQGICARYYLLYLRRICPQRFSCRLYACRMLNYGPISDRKVIWIAPCSDRINFIYFNNNSYNSDDAKISDVSMPNIKQIKSISLPFLVSYGLQSNGIYFFVYRTLHLPASSPTSNINSKDSKLPKEVEQKVDKLSVLISDPCSAKELTTTLKFLCNGLNF